MARPRRGIAVVLQFAVPLLCLFGAFASFVRRRKRQALAQAPTGSRQARAFLDERTAAHPVNFATRRVELPLPGESPACPVCRKAMVRRTARTGPSIGSQFWGCSAYPACRGTR